MKTAFLAFSFAIGATLLIQAFGRGIDPDELEHVHAACAVSWGDVPYRDFFEHHGPGLYYALQPILRITGAEVTALWWSRALMWATGMATLAIVAAMAGRMSGRTAAAAAPVLLGCTTIFFWKTVEVRPDVPAMFLLTAAAYVMIAAPQRRPTLAALLIGFLLGLATLFTQKALVPAAAMILAQLLLSCRHRQAACGFALDSPKTAIGRCIFVALGAASTWLIAIGLFWGVGAASAFLEATVYQLWRWPVRQSPLTALRPTVLADLTLWIGAAAAIAASLCGSRRAATDAVETQFRGRFILSLTVLLCFVLGLFVKAAYSQYYLLWFPLAAVVAADWLVRLGSGTITSGQRRSWFAVLAMLVVFEAAAAVLAIHRGAEGALPHLLAQSSTIAVAAIAGGFIVLVAAAAGFSLVRGHRAAVVLCLATLGLGYAGLRNLDALCWSSRSQVAALQTVDRLVGPNETVFDGFTGLGAFHRHAFYYWWLNPYSLRLMEGDARGRDLLASLKRSPPKLICADENVRMLPESVLAWIDENYRPIESPLYLRKETVTVPARERAD